MKLIKTIFEYFSVFIIEQQVNWGRINLIVVTKTPNSRHAKSKEIMDTTHKGLERI